MRILFLLILLAPEVLGQVNDRRRAKSDVYSRKARVESQMDACHWKLSSVFVQPILGIAQLGYDSNVYSVEDNEVSDFTVVPQIGLESFWRMSPRLIWRNRAAYNAHIAAASTRDFREKLGPMSGALYDERLYKRL